MGSVTHFNTHLVTLKQGQQCWDKEICDKQKPVQNFSSWVFFIIFLKKLCYFRKRITSESVGQEKRQCAINVQYWLWKAVMGQYSEHFIVAVLIKLPQTSEPL